MVTSAAIVNAGMAVADAIGAIAGLPRLCRSFTSIINELSEATPRARSPFDGACVLLFAKDIVTVVLVRLLS